MRRKKTTPEQIHPDTIVLEITNNIRRISKILKAYDDVGNGLDRQVALKITGGKWLTYTINPNWPVSIKDAVKKVITDTAASKFPQITSISISAS
jgi:hypothetical protein